MLFHVRIGQLRQRSTKIKRNTKAEEEKKRASKSESKESSERRIKLAVK